MEIINDSPFCFLYFNSQFISNSDIPGQFHIPGQFQVLAFQRIFPNQLPGLWITEDCRNGIIQFPDIVLSPQIRIFSVLVNSSKSTIFLAIYASHLVSIIQKFNVKWSPLWRHSPCPSGLLILYYFASPFVRTLRSAARRSLCGLQKFMFFNAKHRQTRYCTPGDF